MARQLLPQLKAGGVSVVELELYNNLGGQGPDITSFGRRCAGAFYSDPSWTWGTASQDLSLAYDSKGYLDVYYLLDADGRVRYVNGSPGPQRRSCSRRSSSSPAPEAHLD